jgi:hypothetical protein
MLCCGILALLATAVLGVWRVLRRIPRLVLVLIVSIIVTGPVAALTVDASGNVATISDHMRAWVMGTLCRGEGVRSTGLYEGALKVEKRSRGN